MTDNPTDYNDVINAVRGNLYRLKVNPEAPLMRITGISDFVGDIYDGNLAHGPFLDIEIQDVDKNKHQVFIINVDCLKGLERVSQTDLHQPIKKLQSASKIPNGVRDLPHHPHPIRK